MKIHYFQRYSKGENVATANTMLLLSRLYVYSSDKFFKLLKSEYFSNFSDSFEPDLIFDLQAKSEFSVPDAIITQNSFKIVVETKMCSRFDEEQLSRHLNAFNDEKHKVLLSIAPVPMAENIKSSFHSELEKHNRDQTYPVIHVNKTFEEIANAISELLDARDYEMQEVLDDYLDYCRTDKLIPESSARKYMRMQLAGNTLEYDMENNVYFNNASCGFRDYRYLGLYKDKSVRAVGKVIARITAIKADNIVQFNEEFGTLTNERKSLIENTMTRYHLENIEHRYFFVDKFYETDFQKTSKGGSWGPRVFDLTEVLETNDIPEKTEELAKSLKTKTWT